MRLTLYAIKHSHPVLAARLMLRAKGLPWTERDALPGLHPIVVRMAGFDDRTVPALVLGDRYVQGTLAISRALDELVPDPPLFGRDPAERAAIEAAERWGHDELQRVAARVFRWAGMRDNRVRAWIADQVIGWPAPVACGIAFQPVMAYYARVIGADAGQVRADLAALPSLLDHADGLVTDGVLGGPDVTAADAQVLASLRLLMHHADLRPAIADRPCGRLALERLPDFPGAPVGAYAPVPAVLPPEWLPA